MTIFVNASATMQVGARTVAASMVSVGLRVPGSTTAEAVVSDDRNGSKRRAVDAMDRAARIARIANMDHLRVAAEYSKIAASVHYAGLHVEAAQGLDCPIDRVAFRNSSEINPDIGASEADGFSWKQFDRIRQLRPGWNWGIAGGARQKSHRLQ